MLSTTPEQVLQHPLNTSPAKVHWSFSKALRTGKVQYNIPSTLTHISYSFPKESRKTRQSPRDHQTPAPGAYSPDGVAKNQGWSFSKAVTTNVEKSQTRTTDGPGPGSYEVVSQNFGLKGVKYTLRPRTVSPSEKGASTRNTPGPGAYESKDSLDSSGHYFIAKYQNSKAATFSPGKKSRFTEKPTTVAPGPGTYDVNTGLKSTGEYFVSGFKSSQSRRFGKAKSRPSSLSQQIVPGPGTYTLPSEFGVYGTPFGSRVSSRRSRKGSLDRRLQDLPDPDSPESPQIE